MIILVILLVLIAVSLTIANIIYIRANMALSREVSELEEKCGKYYMRLLGQAAQKDA